MTYKCKPKYLRASKTFTITTGAIVNGAQLYDLRLNSKLIATGLMTDVKAKILEMRGRKK